ncbi:MAG: F0F1 ATP synthase subunit epsilon [Deltaproteobacteria bacterium]|nr:F0F1 ATP synthase subunit epsilon [Deltaproteobacteria bacterium]MBW1935335.1 F0F1 ATP synthase subunit epsilon [Deltaproteobacteria bacterium]RLB34831.1 MAG: F0F1 ATP synthase subunit epsilon [Deltaproteobacteria bacterium]
MGKLILEVVTPARRVVKEEVDMVVAPGTEGMFGVLPGHMLFLSGIVPGELSYNSGSERTYLAVTNGFAEISNDRVSILVDAAEKAADIDVERARRAMQRAKERLSKERGTEEIDFKRAEAALQRAMARIKVAEKAA